MEKASNCPMYSGSKIVYSSWGPGTSQTSSDFASCTSSFKDKLWQTQPRPYQGTLSYTCNRGVTRAVKWWEQSTDPASEYGTKIGLYPTIDLFGLQQYRGGSGIDIDAALTRAKNECIMKAGEHRFNSIEFAAEFGKTVETMRDLAILALNWKKMLARLHRSQLESVGVRLQVGHSFNKDVSGLLDTLSNAWMVWRYSICTSMMDVEDIVAASHEQFRSVRTGTKRLKRRPQAGLSTSRTWTNQPSMGLVNIYGATYMQKLVSVRVDYSYIPCVWIKVAEDVSSGGSIFHRWGLNPVEVAWNLTPMSFVADWSLNIGDYLAGQTALLGKTVLDAGFGVEERLALIATNTGMAGPSWETPLRAVGNISFYNREPWTPAFEYQMAQSASDALNWKRLLDAASIFRKL